MHRDTLSIETSSQGQWMLRFALNDGLVKTATRPGLPALDYLRADAGLTGVKYACREGDCGSCAILLGQPVGNTIQYRVVTSCLLPIGALHGHHVVTIEGLNGRPLSPIQSAFEGEGASQCGFCTPGFVVAFTGYLLEAKQWDESNAIEAIAGNICRCTGYASIRRSLTTVLDQLQSNVNPKEERIPALVREGLLPEYFLRVGDLVGALEVAKPTSPPKGSQVVVAGGTDLYVQRPDELPERDVLVLPIETESPIWQDGDHIYLAATATAEDMKRSEILDKEVGGIERAMRLMGSLPIRQRATIAGNIVNASPIGDMTIALLALDAEISLVTGDSHRSLPLREFFIGYKDLDLRSGELVEWIRFQTPGGDALFNFEKVSKRTHLDIASVNTAMSVKVRGGRIQTACVSAGGVAPIPMQLRRTGEFLAGRLTDSATAFGAAEVARSEVMPISDVRGTADYKQLLLGQLILAHFNVLFGIGAELLEEASA
jgi:xanthine dehydrogenase small subunit